MYPLESIVRIKSDIWLGLLEKRPWLPENKWVVKSYSANLDAYTLISVNDGVGFTAESSIVEGEV